MRRKPSFPGDRFTSPDRFQASRGAWTPRQPTEKTADHHRERSFRDHPRTSLDQTEAASRKGREAGEEKWGSRPVSRVLSWTAIHLGRTSPCASSDLPGSGAGRAIAPLFGLAPGGVYRAAECCHRRGALLPHLFTLAGAPEGALAVCFLWHFPSARAAQALPGTLPCGARTFLPARRRRGCPADSRKHYTSGRPPGGRYSFIAKRRPAGWGMGTAWPDESGPTIHAFTHSRTHALTHSRTHALTHSRTQSPSLNRIASR